MNMDVTITDASSARLMDAHIPDAPMIKGKTMIAPTSNTSVRKKEIAADMVPLLSEVKNEDPKIEKPMSKNAKE